MPDTANIAAALGLDADATETAILDRINALELPEGDRVMLSADEAAELMSKAAAGEAAVRQLADDRFAAAWGAATANGRALPAQKDLFRRLYDQDPDLAVKTLDALRPVVPTSPTGQTGDAVDVPDGVDQERARLDRAAQAYADEKGVSYLDALDAVADKVLGGVE